jgi:hypothetical protein
MSGIPATNSFPSANFGKVKKDLKLLMKKAKQSTGGSAISVVAYQGDYVNAREELQVIDATARAKKCKMPDDWQTKPKWEFPRLCRGGSKMRTTACR